MNRLRALAARLVRGPYAELIRDDLHDLYERDRARGAGVWRAHARFARRLGASAVSVWSDRRSPASRAPLACDLRDGWRALRASPWYTVTAIGILGLGLTMTTMTFAVVDGVLFKPLPYPRAHEIFLIRADASGAPLASAPAVSWDEIAAWRSTLPELAITAISATTGRDERHAGMSVHAADIDDRFFDVFGIQPAIGGFAPDDWSWLIPGARLSERPQLVSYRLWVDQYGGDPDAVGRTIVRSDRNDRTFAVRIAGVLPPGFVFPTQSGQVPPDVLGPIARARQTPQGAPFARARAYHAFIRVPPDRAVDAVQSRLAAATRELARRPTPPAPPGHVRPDLSAPFDQVRLVPIGEHLGRNERASFALVLATSALVLLLACLNLAGLVVTRVLGRQYEISTRLALGASRWLIVRGQTVELALLVFPAMALALLASGPLLAATLTLLPPDLTLLKAPAIDVRVLAVAALAAFVSLVLVMLWPARASGWLATRGSALDRPGPGRDGRRGAWRGAVMGQVALGFVLVSAAVLTTGSLATAWTEDTGYARDRLVLIEAYASFYRSSADAVDQLEAVRNGLRGVPGVASVAVASIQPLFESETVAISGAPAPGSVVERRVSANYFETMQLDPVEGAWPPARQWAPDADMTVISESTARRLFGDAPAVGRVVDPSRLGRPQSGPALRIVAVVRDARYLAPDQAPMLDLYRPGPIAPTTYGVFFIVRTTDPADAVLPALLAVTSAHRMTVPQATTVHGALLQALRPRLFAAWLFGLLGAAGIAMLAAGLFGLLAAAAHRRRREIGIRSALGATRASVLRQFASEQVVAVSSGLLGGAGLTLIAGRVLESQLYGVGVLTPGFWLVSTGAVLIAVTTGTLLPVLRASAVDPTIVLRADR